MRRRRQEPRRQPPSSSRKAKTYVDWRKCLDQKDIDAVVCSTTDHTHAFVNVWAMNRGQHVYCEKPLANSVQEARIVRETYLKNKGKLATQMGTQIHASDNYRRVVELIRRGAIGNVAGGARLVQPHAGRRQTTCPAASRCPRTSTGTSGSAPRPYHPYNPGYLRAAAWPGTASGTSAAARSATWAAT